MIEQDAVAGEKVVALSIIDRRPVSGYLRNPIRAARMEERLLGLRHFMHLAEHLAAARLVETRMRTGLAHGFQQTQASSAGDVEGAFWSLEAPCHVALRRQIIDL